MHARAGNRAAYRPVVSRLLPDGDADPVRLAAHYRAIPGVRRAYAADLDAIAGAPPDQALLVRLAGPEGMGAPLLVDAGIDSLERARQVVASGNRIVAGLESLGNLRLLSQLADNWPIVFSLDLRAGQPVVPTALALDARARDAMSLARAAAEAGVTAILVLDVARVGTNAGPHLPLLGAVRAAFRDGELLAGGGIRGEADLTALAGVGVDAALVATALHEGRLPGPA